MIRPTKYMNLQTNLLSISAEILAELMKVNIISLQELDEVIQDRLGERVRTYFVPAINFLFLLGRVDYDNDSDAVFYTPKYGQ